MGLVRYHNRKIPKRSRTIPLYGDPIRGDGLDFGKYYRCWNCGAICNVDVNALGGSESGSGVVLETYIETPDRTSGQYFVILKSPINHFQVALANGGDGTPKEIVHKHVISTSSSGCPQCGTLNWRGDYH